ncbi:type I polyketide synthase [Hyphococcus lacteus]|uniref:Type I polyketide synthase n=1 Tax=Hyphococcus lacteus TaxID=3143536 RepID=A0ABV3Z315_9PROT
MTTNNLHIENISDGDASPTEGIAIVGMSGRFPGAKNVDAFWRNIKNGVESITHFSPDELEISDPSGHDKDAGDYVCAKGMLDDIDMFDARFFGYLPREAEVMDPQHRIFLEICWEAMENAGYDAHRYSGSVGVYGGCYMDTYLLWNLCSDENFRERLVESIQVGSLQTELGNDKDYLATRVAYKLGLRGPAMTLQTACSTSLVAIATACQSIEAYQCDMALAGGVTIILPQKKGYFYKEGGMLSPDGHCRTFDSNAAGTVFSHGAAVVLLKRVEDAIADGDTIYGVIRGYATNNDGGDKVSYTAPSVEGQAEVISLALGMADIDARSIGYVEAHGTATPLGDPIEVAGLTTAYRTMTNDNQYCAIGSVKANLGHLDVASGAIGLIKTSLSLQEKILPPMINFENPNPKIDFENSPFFVNTKLQPWTASEWPRRAGVSSFGVGGTNAHVVVEEPPVFTADNNFRKSELLLLSARSKDALTAQAEQMASHLEADTETSLADIAYTLQVGRREFEHRRAISVSSRDDAIVKLRTAAVPGTAGVATSTNPEYVFMFPGQGAQYPGMGRALYESETVYRDTIDAIATTLIGIPEFGIDIRRYLLWSDEQTENRETLATELAQTKIAQPTIFAVEVAMARLLQSWGISPAATIGHSVGEFASAVIAGVFTLADATKLVAARGRLMQAQPTGRMLAVMGPRDEVEPLLPNNISIAAINAPGATVVSGPAAEITGFQTKLEAMGMMAKPLQTSHAFHSRMMTKARAPLEALVNDMQRSPASVEIISTERGGVVDPNLFCDPIYWGEQLMNPVLFADAISAAAVQNAHRIFIEVGPGQTLSALSKQTLTGDLKRVVTPTLGPVNAPGCDVENALAAVGRIWVAGGLPDWSAFTVGARRRVPLPTYPFERKRHWVEPMRRKTTQSAGQSAAQDQTSTNKAPMTQQTEVEDLIQQQLGLISDQLNILKQN